jgi:hypothetical protein
VDICAGWWLKNGLKMVKNYLIVVILVYDNQNTNQSSFT